MYKGVWCFSTLHTEPLTYITYAIYQSVRLGASTYFLIIGNFTYNLFIMQWKLAKFSYLGLRNLKTSYSNPKYNILNLEFFKEEVQYFLRSPI